MTFSLKKIQEWCYRSATSRWSGLLLFAVAFADAVALSIPLSLILLGMIALNPPKAYRFATFTLLGVLAGSTLGYYIGQLLWLTPSGEFSPVASFVFSNVPGITPAVYQSVQQLFEKWDFWVLFAVSFVPAPQTLVTIFAGVLDINVFIFIAATVIGQSIRYYAFTWAVVRYGPRVKQLAESYYKPIALVASAVVVVAIIAYSIY